MKGKQAILVVFMVTVFLPAIPISQAFADATNAVPPVIISEVKLGGDSYSQGTDQPKDPQEFITLYNQSSDDINLSGWVLEYAKPTFDKSFCSDTNWLKHNVSGSVSQTTLTGNLQPGHASTPISRALTDNSGGSLHLVNAADKNNLILEDLVGWGTNAPCSETAPASTPSNGKSIKRYLDCNTNAPIDTKDNSQNFAGNQPPSPGTLANPYLINCENDSTTNAAVSSQAITCEGVVVSELLPNPAGTDTGNEFIELYNPTGAVILLQGCSLQTTANSKVFNFPNITLQPGEYHAFSNSETGLTMANSAGGTVWLLSPSTELQAIPYPANLDDDVAWAFVAGSWQATYQPTPNAANVLIATKPCAAGEERNPDTGYCHNTATVSASSLAPCKEGQERNLDTNRCRNATTAPSSTLKTAKTTSSALTPCKPGQERNPATNRCRSIVTTASATLKPCAAGQERNPATNRCRKISAASAAASKLSTVKDNVSGSMITRPHWWLAGFAAVGATSYGVYEWRQEALQFLGRLKKKLFR
jgi:hypothetical protein